MAADKWLEWITKRRFGGDAKIAAESMIQFHKIRDKILDGAKIREGDTVLDIGTGDGLMGFGALAKVGLRGKVIFSDISSDCVETCKEIYSSVENKNPADFIVTKAEDLCAIPDKSIDAVVFRSVLIYINDKQACFKEFARILKPGGRLSFFEPLNIFTNRHKPKNSFYGHDITPVAGLWSKVMDAYPRTEKADDPMINFDEDDLFRYAQESGFTDIEMEYQAFSRRSPAMMNWDMLYKGAPNPNAPTLEEMVNKSLSPEEKTTLVSYLKNAIESEPTVNLLALCYVSCLNRD